MKEILFILLLILIDGTTSEHPLYELLMRDILVNADLWSNDPEILSAEYSFDGIAGIDPLTEENRRKAGGARYTAKCADGTSKNFTSGAAVLGIQVRFGYPVIRGDAMPIVFSWPVLPSTVQRTDFEIELNTGDIVAPASLSIFPNQDYNERNTIIVFSPDFGNRKFPNETGAIYPVRVRVVEDEIPLQLFGPDGPVSAVGLTYETKYHPYVNGTTLLKAKLSHMNETGDDNDDGVVLTGGFSGNNGRAIYGDEATYRLRLLTGNNNSPYGIKNIRPNEFGKCFQLAVMNGTGTSKTEIILTLTGKTYMIDNKYPLKVLGLAELGPPSTKAPYDDCYNEDSDNQIDIILNGHQEAMRRIVGVIAPASKPYYAFYNPGGPGLDPFPEVRYTAPSKYERIPVIMALDDPMTVTYQGSSTSTGRMFRWWAMVRMALWCIPLISKRNLLRYLDPNSILTYNQGTWYNINYIYYLLCAYLGFKAYVYFQTNSKDVDLQEKVIKTKTL